MNLRLCLLLLVQPASLMAKDCQMPGIFSMHPHPTETDSVVVEWDTDYLSPLNFRTAEGGRMESRFMGDRKVGLRIGSGVSEVFVSPEQDPSCERALGFVQANVMDAAFEVVADGDSVTVQVKTKKERRTRFRCSVDGGESYPVEATLAVSKTNPGIKEGSCTVHNLDAGSYAVWVRWGDSAQPTQVRRVAIGDGDRLSALERELQEAKDRNAALVDLVEELSETTQRLRGSIGSVTRMLMSTDMRLGERFRNKGNSGLIVARGDGGTGLKAYHRGTHEAAAVHRHAYRIGTLGMGEYQAVLNGVQFQTRHNDYSLRQPHTEMDPSEAAATFPPPSMKVKTPPVPPSVLQQASVRGQIAEMREYFRAFKDQNTTHRDYRPYFKPVLCVLEGGWVNSEEGETEPSSSSSSSSDWWEDQNMEHRFHANSGGKSRRENIPHIPSAIREVDNGFEPVAARWFSRVSCWPLKNDVSTARFRVKDELHQQMSFGGKPLTKEELASTSHAVFDVRPDLEASNVDLTSPWPDTEAFGRDFVDEMMEQVPGFDGTKQFLKSDFNGDVEYSRSNKSALLNSAYYTRSYSLGSSDAMGTRGQRRGFHESFWAAQTVNKRVSPQMVCRRSNRKSAMCESQLTVEKCREVKFSQTSPVSTQRCKVKKGICRYQPCSVQRWTYAMPLEIVYMTPLTKWNPYEIPLMSREEQLKGGKNGTKKRPYNGASGSIYARTPSQFYGGYSGRWARGGDGTAKEVLASGYRTFIPVAGVGNIRQRFPIFQSFEHETTAYKEVKALQEVILRRKEPEVRDIIEELLQRF